MKERYQLILEQKRHYLEKNLLSRECITNLIRSIGMKTSFYFKDAAFGYCFVNEEMILYCSVHRDYDREDYLEPKKFDAEVNCFSCDLYPNYIQNDLPVYLKHTCIEVVKKFYYDMEKENWGNEKYRTDYRVRPIHSTLMDIKVYRIRQDMYTHLYKNLNELHYNDDLENGPFIYTFFSDVGLEFIFDNGRRIVLWRDTMDGFFPDEKYFYDTKDKKIDVLSCCFKRMKQLACKYNRVTYEDFIQDKDREMERQLHPNDPKDFCPLIGNIQLISVKSITDPLYTYNKQE